MVWRVKWDQIPFCSLTVSNSIANSKFTVNFPVKPCIYLNGLNPLAASSCYCPNWLKRSCLWANPVPASPSLWQNSYTPFLPMLLYLSNTVFHAAFSTNLTTCREWLAHIQIRQFRVVCTYKFGNSTTWPVLRPHIKFGSLAVAASGGSRIYKFGGLDLTQI